VAYPSMSRAKTQEPGENSMRRSAPSANAPTFDLTTVSWVKYVIVTSTL
jgi:hypothetical protein